jgi:hypothetical protein
LPDHRSWIADEKICLLLSLLALNGANAASSPDVAKYLAQRGWTAYDNKARLAMPANDIAPLTYYAKGANVPSCGLLAGTASAPKFIDILSTEPGEQYPHCAGINDVAAFKLAGKDYLVFTYTDRDTRNESYEQFFYVYKSQTGDYLADTKLNEAVAGEESGKSSRKANDGIRLARKYAVQ